MQFRRVDALPPYAFAEIERLKLELRRAGEDVIDLGFGNPDVPPPEVAVEKLREAALLPRNHRYSSSRGLPKLREAICDLYRDRFASISILRPRRRSRSARKKDSCICSGCCSDRATSHSCRVRAIRFTS